MAAGAWTLYNSFKENMGDGVIDMDGDNFAMALFLSTSNAATLTNATYGALTNEVASAYGYTTGGVVLTLVTWTASGGTVTWDCADVSWTASGGSITARYAVIYCTDTKTPPTGTITKPLVCYSLLDTTPADVTITTGNTLTIQINASGVFTLTG